MITSTNVVNAMLQSLTLASLALVTISGMKTFASMEQSQLISSSMNGDDNTEDDDKQIPGSLGYRLIKYLLGDLVPLACIFGSNLLLLPVRMASLLVIEILVSGRSFSGREHNISANKISIFAHRYQTLVVHFVFFIFDYTYHLWRYPETSSRVFLGYLIMLIPITVFLNPLSSQKIGRLVSIPKIQVAVGFFLSFLLLSIIYSFQSMNWKMILVTLGSLIILTVSQVDLENIARSGRAMRIFKQYITNENYKVCITALNVVMAAILLLSLNSNTTQITFKSLEQYLIEFSWNIIVMMCICPPNQRPLATPTDEKSKELQEETEQKMTFLSLLAKLIRYEDSRSIFNYLLLNLSFMFVQILYSFRSKSLSLLSDSLHMFLDCMSLFLGLLASIISQNNAEHPNKSYPFGLARVETLAGFTNGSLLLGVVFGIFKDAIERLITPVKLQNTTELLIVSILGLLVNVVGIFAFGHDTHHHHGHGHDHHHNHEHHHGHEHSHEHHHTNHRVISETLDPTAPVGTELPVEDSADVDPHKNDNMDGIFLHIMADTLGSVGVVLSTLLVKYFGWKLIDPLTSILIGSLILVSAIPLLKSSSSTLLLSLQTDTAGQLKKTLEEVRNVPGVKSYSTPRFWPRDDSYSKLIGYIHVIYYRTENPRLVKQQIDEIMKGSPAIDTCFVQVENEIDDCWCRSKEVFSTDG